jgi:hypothetical protein
MEKVIHLKNLTFRQIYVHGRHIPSVDSLPIGKVQKHCGSEQCDKSYSTIYKKSYRALNNQPKRRIEKSFDGKPKDCIICGEKRIVNRDGYCNECFK